MVRVLKTTTFRKTRTLPVATYTPEVEPAVTLESLTPLARWALDPRAVGHVFTDAARTTPAGEGDVVEGLSDLTGQGFTWTGGGSGMRYTLAQGGLFQGDGTRYFETEAAQDIDPNTRAWVIILRANTIATQGLITSRIPTSQGGTLQADSSGFFDLLHHDNVTFELNQGGYAPGQLTAVIWWQTGSGGIFWQDGVSTAFADNDDATAIGQAIHYVGSLTGGGSPFDGDIAFAGAWDTGDVTFEDLTAAALGRVASLNANQILTQGPKTYNLDGVRMVGQIIGTHDASIYPTLEYRTTPTSTGTPGAWTDVPDLDSPIRHATWAIPVDGVVASGETYTVEVRDKTSLGSLGSVTVGGGKVDGGLGQSNWISVTEAAELTITQSNARLFRGGGQAAVRTDTTMRGWHAAYLDARAVALGVPLELHCMGQGALRIVNFLPTNANPSTFGDLSDPDNLLYSDLPVSMNIFDLWVYSVIREAGLDPDDYDPVRDGRILATIMWMQGETDASANTAEATYEGHIATIIAALIARFATKVGVWIQFDVAGSAGGPELAGNDAVQQAQADTIAGDANVYELTDQRGVAVTAGGGVHYTTVTELQTLGAAVAAGVAAGAGNAA